MTREDIERELNIVNERISNADEYFKINHITLILIIQENGNY